jgi:hypothetical protein
MPLAIRKRRSPEQLLARFKDDLAMLIARYEDEMRVALGRVRGEKDVAKKRAFRRGGVHLSPEGRVFLRKCHREGYTASQTARLMGISTTAAARWYRRFEQA